MAKSASGMDFGLVLGIALHRLRSGIGVGKDIHYKAPGGIYERMNFSTEGGNETS